MHNTDDGVDKRLAKFNSQSWTIVCDTRCPVVKRLSQIVKKWDRKHFFRFVKYDTTDADVQPLILQLQNNPWSLLLVDDENNSFYGPEAIPFILKNLPFGRIAAVAYILPGTMWLTRQLYYLVSKNRHLFSRPQKPVLKAAPTSSQTNH